MHRVRGNKGHLAGCDREKFFLAVGETHDFESSLEDNEQLHVGMVMKWYEGVGRESGFSDKKCPECVPAAHFDPGHRSQQSQKVAVACPDATHLGFFHALRRPRWIHSAPL